ncbi:hypothetical protein F7230_07115 [Corynebacterium sp. 320]|uniref:Uncharacterized protein n=1 Tax=Corynebacterium zhongnanshanii TaxID=2768834 RepID=A0ABQ6VBU8_9CORY|nr:MULTISPECIES: hypothetical protein [Corynebacterium]KAB1502774.1 hypothetical protein F7230_07115 [Corynebacterium sp. 320]KAB1550485.1 hypothetical protein F7232_09395 [Corynebacterium sp. 319]KAB1554784.1 hypothetical protein F7233_00430 [Corynebacterium sp. 321]KAB3519205.1 hypothetical protein F8377_09445 [Corynebacterium zhongnanshanii]KAB3526437.1 hypothetical protein F8354_07115 [Corynebacterium sp. 250]
MNATMILTMASVLIGFLFFGAAFATFSYKKPPKLVWSLFVVAIFFVTIIPVTLAIFVAA